MCCRHDSAPHSVSRHTGARAHRHKRASRGLSSAPRAGAGGAVLPGYSHHQDNQTAAAPPRARRAGEFVRLCTLRGDATRHDDAPEWRLWCERCKPEGAQRRSRRAERARRIVYGSCRRVACAAAACAAAACAAPAVLNPAICCAHKMPPRHPRASRHLAPARTLPTCSGRLFKGAGARLCGSCASARLLGVGAAVRGVGCALLMRMVAVCALALAARALLRGACALVIRSPRLVAAGVGAHGTLKAFTQRGK